MPGPSIDQLPDAVRRIAAMAQSGDSPEALRRALATELLTVLGADQAHIIDLDEYRRPSAVISVRAESGSVEHKLDESIPASAISWVAETGRTAVTSDARRPGVLPADLVSRFGLVTAAILPVTVAGETRGVAIVGSRTPRSWPTEEVRAAASLAEVLATGVALQQSRHDASVDHLTGCLNHGAMRARLEEEIDRASRQGTALAVLLIDLDDFKSVNDRYGHPTGDALLREVGRALTSEFRSFDQVARYGGDEFLVMLPNVRGPRSDLAASRALRLLRKVRFERPDGKQAAITVSVGLTEWHEGETTADLLRKASSALRAGKTRGKDRVGRFERAPEADPVDC